MRNSKADCRYFVLKARTNKRASIPMTRPIPPELETDAPEMPPMSGMRPAENGCGSSCRKLIAIAAGSKIVGSMLLSRIRAAPCSLPAELWAEEPSRLAPGIVRVVNARFDAVPFAASTAEGRVVKDDSLSTLRAATPSLDATGRRAASGAGTSVG